ncbi:anti-sigma factor family protein [Streptomyces minutiscleroticus]|uniref:Membrane protein n=1 Tax=Streptomyces minutiscleroticus TaxID=68238 RepID=A0A918KBE5_9ACTN|nr:zf-HC2 domain-containing protein [Streptomyces minutiscleroticus]GGX56899.1 membrane protein [Streptomyces minutiscleroticus]
MTGSRPTPAEQHLGDRLSALVDGELGHEARERVLAHLATCAKCKAEADEQRRLKSVFAEVAPPTPSESFLARLQGLPAGDDRSGGPAPGGSGFGTSGVFGMKEPFGYAPSGPHSAMLPSEPEQRGFRIHDVGRREAERSASRGLRFAFAAAGAVSLAAIALGGMSVGMPTDTTDARGGSGSNVTPSRGPGAGAAPSDGPRRRSGVGPLLAQTQRRGDETPVAPVEAAAPLLPGVPAPAAPPSPPSPHRTPYGPHVPDGAVATSPLIRPLAQTPPVTLAAWPTVPALVPPVLLSEPVPGDPSVTPSPTSPR